MLARPMINDTLETAASRVGDEDDDETRTADTSERNFLLGEAKVSR